MSRESDKDQVVELKRQAIWYSGGYDRKTISKYVAEPAAVRCMGGGIRTREVGASQVVSEGEGSGGSLCPF